jgi:hypothetical protein
MKHLSITKSIKNSIQDKKAKRTSHEQGDKSREREGNTVIWPPFRNQNRGSMKNISEEELIHRKPAQPPARQKNQGSLTHMAGDIGPGRANDRNSREKTQGIFMKCLPLRTGKAKVLSSSSIII